MALDPGFALAWAEISLCHTGIYLMVDSSPQEAEAARSAAERAVELAPELSRSSIALAVYHLQIRKDATRARDVYLRAAEAAPDNADLLILLAASEERWEKALELLSRAETLDPRSVGVRDALATTLIQLRRGGEARAACDRGLALAPANLDLLDDKVATYLQAGDLAGARAVVAAAPKEVRPTDLVAYFGMVQDLDWVLDDAGRDLLLRLTPAAFFEDRGNWGIVLAQAASRRADAAKVREYAEEASKSFAAKVAQDPRQGQTRALLGLSLAYLGRREEAVREGERAVSAALSAPSNILEPTYVQHQLVRIHILCGNYEKALDLLEPLLKVPYYLTPAWLRIDPNFDPLRKNPRFQKLVAGK